MYIFVQKENLHHCEGALWSLCCASNTPCVLLCTGSDTYLEFSLRSFPAPADSLWWFQPRCFSFWWWFVLLGCNICESVSVALFRDWPHAYSSGQSSFAKLGCSFSTAVSCFLLGLVSVSGNFFFLTFFKVPFFSLGLVVTEGLGLCLNLCVANLLWRV